MDSGGRSDNLMAWLPGTKYVEPDTRLTTLAYVASTTSADELTITAMDGIDAGDLLILCVKAQLAATPSGFASAGSAFSGHQFWYKIAEGDEDEEVLTFAQFLGTTARAILIQLRGDVPIIGLNARAGGNAGMSLSTSGNPTAQTLNASAGIAPVAGVTLFSSSSAIDPRTTSITPTEELSAATNFYAHLYIQESAPADYTWDMDDEGSSNILVGTFFHNMVG